MKTKQGFTLIEMILVMGLVLTLGAMAAPQFTDVFDKSKDKADIAQMDQILAAFQMQQGMVFDNHAGDYDMANPKFIDYQTDDEGNRTAALQSEAAEKALNIFLMDVLTSPGSAVYMEGVKSARDGKMPTKDDLIYKVAASSTHVWLIHKVPFGPDLESNVKVRIPGVKVVEYEYSEGDPVNGTWHIVGDDDRLRADYVEDYLKKDEKRAKQLNEKLKKNLPYKYKTKFRIDTIMEEDLITRDLGENIVFQEDWIIWAPSDFAGIAHDGMKKGPVPDDIKIEYFFNSSWNTLGDQAVQLHLPPGQNAELIVFRFIKIGEKTLERKYKIDTVKYTNNTQDMNEGFIQCMEKNKNHYFHYKHEGQDQYLEGSGSGSEPITEKIMKPAFFYTGFILNINQTDHEKKDKDYKQYDFLAFHYNEDIEQTELIYYKANGNGNANPIEQDRVALEEFQYNHAYTMELEVTKEKSLYVTLYDDSKTLLSHFQMKTDNNTLRPAIGFYMNQSVKIEEDQTAEAEKGGKLPLVSYTNGGVEGPRFIILKMPEFYPYDSSCSQPTNPGGGSSSEADPDSQTDNSGGHDDLGETKFSIPTIEYDVENDQAVISSLGQNQLEYQWVYDLNYKGDVPDSSTGGQEYITPITLNASGWLYAREVKGTEKSDQWVKMPWVGDDFHKHENYSPNIVMNNTGMEYKYKGEPWDSFDFKIRKANGNWQDMRTYTFDPKIDMNFEVQIRYNEKNISKRISKIYKTSNVKDKQPPTLTIQVEPHYQYAGNSENIKSGYSKVTITSDEEVKIISEGFNPSKLAKGTAYEYYFTDQKTVTIIAEDCGKNKTSATISLEWDAEESFRGEQRLK